MQLSKRIAAILERHPGNRPADIARAAGVSTASVADWMNGTTKSMKPEPARKLSVRYGCDQNWLMTGLGGPAWRATPGETQLPADQPSRSITTLRDALMMVREHLARGSREQNEQAAEALKLMATVPDSDRAFEQALSSLSSIK